jgi:hypothetical protein
MSNEQDKPKRIVREIYSITVCNRIGAPGSLDTDLETFTARDSELVPEDHKIFGPGMRVRSKAVGRAGFSKFVPITNIRDVQYTEREE